LKITKLNIELNSRKKRQQPALDVENRRLPLAACSLLQVPVFSISEPGIFSQEKQLKIEIRKPVESRVVAGKRLE
jgi:hypothetical protein